MGMQICLGNPDDNRFGENILNKYYDYRAEKEMKFFPEDSPEDLYVNSEREWMLKELKKKDDEKYPICEHLPYDLLTPEMDRLFSYADETIYNDDIRTFIDYLREKNQESESNEWDTQIKVTILPLCEFAYENELGVRLSV